MEGRVRASDRFHVDSEGLAFLMGSVFDAGSLDRSGRHLAMAGSASDDGSCSALMDAEEQQELPIGEGVETGSATGAAAAKAKAKAKGKGKAKAKPAKDAEAEVVTPTGDSQGSPASIGKWVAGMLKDIAGARDVSSRLDGVPYCGEPNAQIWGLLCVLQHGL